MTSRFRVLAFVDRAQVGPAVVEINRRAGTISIRRLRGRKAYVLPLGLAADIIATKVIKAEVALKRRRTR